MFALRDDKPESEMRSVLIAMVLATTSTAAFAQSYQSDYERLRQQGIERNDAAARAHGFEQQERERQEEANRRGSQSSPSIGSAPSLQGGPVPPVIDMRAQGKELLRLPPLPDERNVLLGSWRLEGGGQQRALLERGSRGGGTGAGAGLGELIGLAAQFDPDKAICEVSFGSGIAFAPTTYSSSGVAGMAGGPVAYRSRNKQVIVSVPADSRANPMPFTIAGPNRIVWADTCALVRVGAPGANAAAIAATAPGNARTGAADSPVPAPGAPPQVAAVAPTPPPSSLSRPSPEVCRNMLLDTLGTVGVNQVRAMSDVRFKEPAIEGRVPNTNNLRIDLRGSACDDPRIKATLYDFDADGMLQSITYVWVRPSGPAPAPIFQERVNTLSRFHSLPQRQSPGRLQADTPLGRLMLQDLPERNLLLEAYAAKK
jgi:hypothetical protein